MRRRVGQPTQPCDFGVIRRGAGFATVSLPGGGERYLCFEGGTLGSTDAEPSPSFERQADLMLIEIAGERYEIPDAVILGG